MRQVVFVEIMKDIVWKAMKNFMLNGLRYEGYSLRFLFRFHAQHGFS